MLIAFLISSLMFNPFTDVIRHYEGLYLEAYKCPAGKWTIGYGHLCSANHPPISKDQAEVYLMQDLAYAYRVIMKELPEDVHLSDNQIAALVSWVFNLGEENFRSSTMLKRLKEGDFEAAGAEMLRWDKCRNPKTGEMETLRGLTKRRKSESTYFLTGEVKIF